MKIEHIIMIGVGAFVAYNLAILVFAIGNREGIFRVVFIAKYAPWLLMNKDFAAYMFNLKAA